jgi:putative Ca2+/H+ antiporter (TMEM165/GDT1 family)
VTEHEDPAEDQEDAADSAGAAAARHRARDDHERGADAAAQATEREPGERVEEELNGLREVFAERRLSIRTMDAPLRLATAGAIASLLGTAVLLVLRDAGSASVKVGLTNGVQVTVSTPVFVAVLVLLAVGFGYLTTGAVLSHPVTAVLGLAAITGGIAFETAIVWPFHSVLPGSALWACRGLLIAVWAVAFAVTTWRRHRHGDDPQDKGLRLLILLVLCGLFGAYLLILRLSSPTLNGLTLFPASIGLLMSGIVILTTPILMIAATDFGEWGQLSGERLLAVVPGRRRARRLGELLVPAAGCIALVVIAWVTQPGSVSRHLYRLGLGVGFTTILLVVLVVGGRLLRLHRQQWPQTLNFAGLFVVVALIFVVFPGAVGYANGLIKVVAPPEVSANGEFTAAANVRSLTGSSGFTILIPAGWQQSTTSTGSDKFDDLDLRYGQLNLIVESAPVGSIESAAAANGLTTQGNVQTGGGLQRLEVTPPTGITVEELWMLNVPNTTHAYVFRAEVGPVPGIATSSDPPAAVLRLEAIVHSFRPPGTTPARIPSEADVITPAAAAQTTNDRLNVFSYTVGLGLGLVVLDLLVTVGRRWSARLRGTVLLLGVTSLVGLLGDFGAIGRLLLGPNTHWYWWTMQGELAGVGVFGLLALAIGARSRRRWATRLPLNLTGLITGMLGLRLIYTLYDYGLSASRVAVWAAIIVLVAMAWDIAMSGESMTNEASRYVPRASRIFLFFGYVILLACAVVFFSGQRDVGSGTALAEAFFEPEAITQAGLFQVAMPLLLLLFLLHTFGEQKPKHAHHD